MLGYRDIKIIKNYAKRVIERDKKQLSYDDWKIIGQDIKTDNEKIKPVIAKRIIMSNLEIANKTITDLLLANDIKPERALNLYKEAETIARNKENSGDLIKIADRYTELHDLKPQKVTYTEQRREVDYTNMLPNQVKKTISTTKTLDNSIKDKESHVSNGNNSQADEQEQAERE